jgi:hypothetical protein
MVAVRVDRIRLEKYRPIRAKATADKAIRSCERTTSVGETPPRRKAILCKGTETKINRNT